MEMRAGVATCGGGGKVGAGAVPDGAGAAADAKRRVERAAHALVRLLLVGPLLCSARRPTALTTSGTVEDTTKLRKRVWFWQKKKHAILEANIAALEHSMQGFFVALQCQLHWTRLAQDSRIAGVKGMHQTGAEKGPARLSGGIGRRVRPGR